MSAIDHGQPGKERAAGCGCSIGGCRNHDRTGISAAGAQVAAQADEANGGDVREREQDGQISSHCVLRIPAVVARRNVSIVSRSSVPQRRASWIGRIAVTSSSSISSNQSANRRAGSGWAPSRSSRSTICSSEVRPGDSPGLGGLMYGRIACPSM